MNHNEAFPALTVTQMNIRLAGAALEIFPDDVEEIHIMVSGNEHAVSSLRIAQTGDTLAIEQPAPALPLPASTGWMQLTLRVPRSWKGGIDARSTSGLMNLRSLQGADLSLETVSGMVMVNDVSFLSITVRTVTGDVKICSAGCRRCSLSTTAGSLSMLDSALNSLILASVTGSAAVSLMEPFQEVSMSSVSGSLALEAPMEACDAVLRSVSGRLRTNGLSNVEGAAKIRAATVTGNLDVSRFGVYEPAPEEASGADQTNMEE